MTALIVAAYVAVVIFALVVGALLKPARKPQLRRKR